MVRHCAALRAEAQIMPVPEPVTEPKRAVKFDTRLLKWNRKKVRRTFYWAHAIRGLTEWRVARRPGTGGRRYVSAHYNNCGQSCLCCRARIEEDWLWSGCFICNALLRPHTQRLSAAAAAAADSEL